MGKLLIVQIPCLNEEKTLPSVVAEIPRDVPGFDRVEVLIIDDGSTDRTIEVAKECGVDHIVQVPTNRGLANAFQTGVDACLKLGADVIVNTDGDNQYPGEYIIPLVQPLIERKADIVIGNRQPRQRGHYNSLKKILHLFGAWAVRKASNTDVQDPVSGFRAISREAALKLNIVTKFSYTTEMVIQAGRKGLKLMDIEMETNAATRQSRLFKSIPSFVGRSGSTILQTYAMFRPLKVFVILGLTPVIIGMIPIVRFLYHYMMGDGEGRIQSLMLGSGMVSIGVVILVFGLLADLLARQRVLLEQALERVRKIELAVDEMGKRDQ
ncbi:MAG: glycosyltransferase family 2 protein [Alphaproteobacteria bacterium]